MNLAGLVETVDGLRQAGASKSDLLRTLRTQVLHMTQQQLTSEVRKSTGQHLTRAHLANIEHGKYPVPDYLVKSWRRCLTCN